MSKTHDVTQCKTRHWNREETREDTEREDIKLYIFQFNLYFYEIKEERKK